MKMKKFLWFPQIQPETVAMFGAARLVRHFDGRHEIIGGTTEQHAAAREWCALFAPEIVFANPPRRGLDFACQASQPQPA